MRRDPYSAVNKARANFCHLAMFCCCLTSVVAALIVLIGGSIGSAILGWPNTQATAKIIAINRAEYNKCILEMAFDFKGVTHIVPYDTQCVLGSASIMTICHNHLNFNNVVEAPAEGCGYTPRTGQKLVDAAWAAVSVGFTSVVFFLVFKIGLETSEAWWLDEENEQDDEPAMMHTYSVDRAEQKQGYVVVELTVPQGMRPSYSSWP